MTKLTPEAVHRILGEFLPAQNDDSPCDYLEELGELVEFGVETEESFCDLMRRRADEVMEIDGSPMDERDRQLHIEECGAEFVESRIRQGYWFSFPALLRIALEQEFGDAYDEFAERRDSGPGEAGSTA